MVFFLLFCLCSIYSYVVLDFLYMATKRKQTISTSLSLSIYLSFFDAFQMEKFEIDACKNWIETNNFHTIALQVPDDDLDKIQDLIDNLQTAISIENIEIFLVGDGCSPCCNDLLNAQYCQAQCLIHFGHSCLALSNQDNQQTIPIFYVFYQQSLP